VGKQSAARSLSCSFRSLPDEEAIMPLEGGMGERESGRHACGRAVYGHVADGCVCIRSDVFGKTDPYCEFTFGDVKHTTATMKKTYNPVWNESVELRLASNALKPLKFVLFDHDVAGSNDEIGEVELSQEKVHALLSAQHGMVHQKAYGLVLQGKPVIGEDKKEAELVVKLRAFPYLHLPEPHKAPAAGDGGLEGGGPLGYPWNDLQQYYLDARKEDRQQSENMKSLQGILTAVTQSTRFATAELWKVHGTAHSAGTSDASNKVAPMPYDANADLESGAGSFGVHLTFSGLRATADSFLSHAAAGPLGGKAKDTYEKFEKVSEFATFHIGEGLEGEALERGEAEFNLLDDYVKNPERQVAERAKIASSLYSASLALPIRASTDPHSTIVAMLMVFLPKDSAAGEVSAREYVDRHKTPVMSYLEQTAKILSFELLKQDALAEYHRLRLSMKYTVNERARQCWSRTRVTVKMGALSTKKAPPAPPPETPFSRLQKWLKVYTGKWKGAKAAPPPRADWTNTGWTFIGVFLGILLPSLINHFALALNNSEFILMMGSFGALATLLYAAPASPFAQPRMVIMGHVVALIVSISVDYFVINALTDGKVSWKPTNSSGMYDVTEVADVSDFSSTAFIPKWLATALVPALAISGKI
jgi:hypothetical protein